MPNLAIIVQHGLQHFGVALRLATTTPSLDVADAFAHAQAAVEASSVRVSPELLLAMAFIESRFDSLAVSRVEGRKRRVGHYASTEPPKRLRKGASLYCGALQTFAASWADCLAQRDLRVAYPAAARELEGWLRDRRVRGDLSRALAGYGCGNRGVRTGKCNRYPGRVQWQARRFASTVAVARS